MTVGLSVLLLLRMLTLLDQNTGQKTYDGMLSGGGQHIHGEEEEILCEDGHPGQARAVLIASIDGTALLDPSPCDVDVEQNE